MNEENDNNERDDFYTIEDSKFYERQIINEDYCQFIIENQGYWGLKQTTEW